MLWVCGHYKYFYSYNAGIDFSRQNLTSTDVRFWRLKSISALYSQITTITPSFYLLLGQRRGRWALMGQRSFLCLHRSHFVGSTGVYRANECIIRKKTSNRKKGNKWQNYVWTNKLTKERTSERTRKRASDWVNERKHKHTTNKRTNDRTNKRTK